METSAIRPSAAGIGKAATGEVAFTWQRYRDLVVASAVRSLKVRYRGSILGIFWSLSNPLLMTGIYTLIFGTAFASYYHGSKLEYALAVFVGLAFVNFFAQGSSMALPSIVSNGMLLNKIALPPSIFPVATIAAATFQLCVGALPLLAIVALVTSHDPLNAVAMIVPAFALVLLSLGMGLAAAAVHVHFRDTAYLYEILMFAIWMTSPIFYPAALVPPGVRSWLMYNPVTAIVESARQIALSGARPSFHEMGAALFAGALVCALGVAVYASLRRTFMDLI